MPLSPPLSLYVHIPWCVRKCPYCDFNSHEKQSGFNEPAYVDALLLDLDREKKQVSQERIVSIFFGGGTPSLFSAGSIKKIINRTADLFETDDIEITLEANPGTFEQEKFFAYRDAGVNRLSIGIQSFHPQHLRELGRIHDGEQALGAIQSAKQAGFDNINLDIMFALPEQSVEQAIEDISIACQQGVEHISHYQLTIEPNTHFHKQPPLLPDADTVWSMQTDCQQHLTSAGYQQYEISAYSQSGRQCSHNRNYWLFCDYIGIGAGAHSKLSNTTSHHIIRQWKHRHPSVYIENTIRNDTTHTAISGKKNLSADDIIFEFLLNILRLKNGCKLSLFPYRTGLRVIQLKQACKDIDPELLIIDKERIRTTEKGFLFLNEILQQLL